MHFYELIRNLSLENNIDLFVDMDGVIASYDFGFPLNFKEKRPLLTSIATLEKVSKLEGVNLFILSICKKDFQINEKNEWLNKYAPFFKKENRFIISKETIPDLSSPNLKLNFLREYKSDNKKILLDDDNTVLKTISKELNNVILLQDSELID